MKTKCRCNQCVAIADLTARLRHTRNALRLLVDAAERYQKTMPGAAWQAAHLNLERKKTFARIYLKAAEERKP